MINKIPDDASTSDLAKLGTSISSSDKAKETAFETYLGTECPDVSSGS